VIVHEVDLDEARLYFQKYWGIDQQSLQYIRMLILIPNLYILAVCLATSEIYELPFFYTIWGHFFSIISIIISIKATNCNENYVLACAQYAQAINLVNMPFFLIAYVPLLSNMEKNSTDLFAISYLVAMYTVPFLSVTANILLTQMTFNKNDWKKIVVMGKVFLIFNCVGQFVNGAPLYPMLDWAKKPLTAVTIGWIISLVQGLFYYGFSVALSNFKEWIDSKV